MKSSVGLWRSEAICRALVVFAAFLTLALRGTAAEGLLYPHAEHESGPWGYVDKTGKIVIPLQFESAQPFSEGLAAVEVHNKNSTIFKKYGFINHMGALIIPPQFQQVRPFQSGRAAVMFPPSRPNPMARWGMIDSDGKLILPATYASIGAFSEGRAIVTIADRTNKHKAGAVDVDGQVVIPLEYDWMMSFSDGLAVARRGKKFGFVDKNGAVVVPFHFAYARPFNSGLGRVFKGPDGESGFIDKTGAVVIPFDYDMVHEFSEGYAVATKRGQGYALIDTAGKVAVLSQVKDIGRPLELPTPYQPPTFYALSDGLLPTMISGKQGYGYVNKEGAVVIQPQFISAYGFHNGVAVVKVSAEPGFGVQGAKGLFSGLIDKSGQFVASPVFEWIKPHAGGLLQVKFGEKLGYIDAQGLPLTFQAKELEDYVAGTREKLKEDPVPRPGEAAKPLPRPVPGRALFAKAGETEYYLRLPDGLCPLDEGQPADRKFVEDRWAESDKAFEASKTLKPMPSDVEALRKRAEDYKLKARYVIRCDQLEKLRAGADSKIVHSYVVATGTQKDRYDPSMGAGAFWANAFICGMLQGDVFKWSDGKEKDSTGTITDAFKRLGAGQAIALRAMGRPLPVCYMALITPDRGVRPGASSTPSSARLVSHAHLGLGDWIVQLQTISDGVASPDDFFREYERDRATIEAIAKANMKQ